MAGLELGSELSPAAVSSLRGLGPVMQPHCFSASSFVEGEDPPHTHREELACGPVHRHGRNEPLPNPRQKCPVGLGRLSPSPRGALEPEPPWLMNMLHGPSS